MSEERLQEIKDSISLQYKVQEANDLNNFNIFTDEEQELVDELEEQERHIKEADIEIERLNNIIKDIKSQLEYIETYSSKEDVFEDMKRRLDRIESIVNRK